MDTSELSRVLNDRRCGLYFLAGLDRRAGATGGETLTVHIVEGAVNSEQALFIKNELARTDADLKVRIRTHSARQLFAPDSLESFAAAFAHDRIVADPTGAFSRASELRELARMIRSELGGSVERIVWRTDDSTLVIKAAGSATEAAPSGKLAAREEWCDEVRSLVDRAASADLRKVILSVRPVATVPKGRYVPVDAGSVESRARKNTLLGLLARVAGAAALVGIGTASAVAGTSMQGMTEDSVAQTPGVTALASLTTLGENSIGVRNFYQAVGGLRLYFGATDLFLPRDGSQGSSGNQRPIRVVY